VVTHRPRPINNINLQGINAMNTSSFTTSSSSVNSNYKTTQTKNLITAYDLGYRVINGQAYSKTGRKIKTRIASNGYLQFCCVDGSRTNNTRNRFKVFVHRMVAYQKYGKDLFFYDCVRHLDGNPHNNNPQNICVGSMSENMMDVGKETRRKRASLAGRKYSDKKIQEIKSFYKQCKSYAKTMKFFDISSKGSLSYVLNNKYASSM